MNLKGSVPAQTFAHNRQDAPEIAVQPGRHHQPLQRACLRTERRRLGPTSHRALWVLRACEKRKQVNYRPEKPQALASRPEEGMRASLRMPVLRGRQLGDSAVGEASAYSPIALRRVERGVALAGSFREPPAPHLFDERVSTFIRLAEGSGRRCPARGVWCGTSWAVVVRREVA